MELLDQQDFSNDQKLILHLRCIEKMSYSQIIVSWYIAFQDDENKQSISPACIKTCFKRSALALKWEKGTIHGNTSYLSNPIIEKLKEYISEECLNEHPSDPSDVLAEAHLIRLERQIKAIHFLRTIKCNNIAEELESEELNEHVRFWLNEHLEELNSKIKSAHVVDFDRYISCTRDILVPYFELINSVLEDSHPTLIFRADESGLEPNLKKKCVIPKEVKDFMLRNGPDLPHFTAMFCNNSVGISVSLFLIILHPFDVR